MKLDMKKKKILFVVLCALCCLSITIMIFTVIKTVKNDDKEIFIAPVFDQTAAIGVPDVPDNLGYSSLNVEQGYKVYVCSNLQANKNKTDVYFTSPQTNTVWILLRIIDEKGNILGETGIIRPGEYVKSLTLITVPDSDAAVKLKIIAYQPETYISMGTVGLNTKLNLTDRSDIE